MHSLSTSLQPQALWRFSDGMVTMQARQRLMRAVARGDASVRDGARQCHDERREAGAEEGDGFGRVPGTILGQMQNSIRVRISETNMSGL
jgi:hypothetical protein